MAGRGLTAGFLGAIAACAWLLPAAASASASASASAPATGAGGNCLASQTDLRVVVVESSMGWGGFAWLMLFDHQHFEYS